MRWLHPSEGMTWLARVVCVLLSWGIGLSAAQTINGLRYNGPDRLKPDRQLVIEDFEAGQNSLPQIKNIPASYYGTLPAEKYLAINELNVATNEPWSLLHLQPTFRGPCAPLAATAAPDSTHSGVLTADTLKRFTIPHGDTMLSNHIFAVCFAEVDGSENDPSWQDAGIRIQFSEVYSVSSHLVTHYTKGYTIARVTDLQFTYQGTLPTGSWLSLVASTKNAGKPCENNIYPETTLTQCQEEGTCTASPADYSGPKQAPAGSKTVVFNTLPLNTGSSGSTISFAVCYKNATETSWRDSAIRVIGSRVTHLKWGPFSTSFPQRTFLSSNVMAATNRLPQVCRAAYLN